MKRIGILLAGTLLSMEGAVAQSPAFDTASVKAVRYSAGDFRAVLGTAIRGEVRLTDATLIECLRFAYGINNNFQIVGPDWMHSREYLVNVIGRAPAQTSIEQLRLMLQTLLIERFQMSLHREPRELSFLALTVAKEGLKMHTAKDGSDASGNMQTLGRISSNSMSITQLSTLLSAFLGQPVLDLTNLQGLFDVKLQWTPASDQSPTEPVGIAPLAAALEEQLGLSLEPRKGPLEVIVVDRAEKKPIGN